MGREPFKAGDTNRMNFTENTMARAMFRRVAIAGAAFAYFLLPFAALAHEGEEAVTNLSEADWVGPLAALIIIIAVAVIARAIKKNN